MSDVPYPLVIQVTPASNFNYEKSLRRQGIDYYETTSFTRGFVKIINVDDPNERREGSEVDVSNLHSLFSQMGFTVDIHDNCKVPPTKDNILQALQEFVQHDRLKNADMVILFIMSHGHNINGRDYFRTLGDQSISYDEVKAYFTNAYCTHMQGKPKLIFFQTCRGDVQDIGTTPVYEQVQFDGNKPSNIPTKSDLLIAFATTPGSVAARWPGIGSLFIWCMCKEFMTWAHERDVATMLASIYRKMLTMKVPSWTNQLILQTGEHTHTLFDRCYLNPGIYRDADGAVRCFPTVGEANAAANPAAKAACATDASPSLVSACRDNDVARVREIISLLHQCNRPLNLDARREACGWTMLHQGARKGHLQICRVLLENCASVDVVDSKGKTALHLAASMGHFDTVQLLVKWGANVELKDRSGKTPADVAEKYKVISTFLRRSTHTSRNDFA